MKKQVLQLAKQMEEVVANNRRKKKYGINLDEGVDAGLQKLRDQSGRQEGKIGEMKKEIFQLKKEAEYVYDQGTVVEKENAVKMLENQVKMLESQKSGMGKVRKEQEKALYSLRDSEFYSEKI